MSDDRIVHAITMSGTKVVHRVDHRKWYVEMPDRLGGGARICSQVRLDEAVELAARRGGIVFLGRPGGKAFDERIKARILKQASS